jgi:hypothetical protein
VISARLDLDGHVSLDVECLDRIYLNGYVPNLQVGGQVVSFMTAHLTSMWVRRAKIEMMRRYIGSQTATSRSAVAAIGVAPEYQNVFAANQRRGNDGVPWFSFTKADRRVSCFYF